MATTRKRSRGNAEGGAYHDKARGRWVGSVTVGYVDGKQVRRSVTAKTKAEVLVRLRELQGAVDQGQDPARRDLTVGRFLDTWLADILPGTVTPGTLTSYQEIVRLYIKPTIGQKRLRTLQAKDVAGMLRRLETEGLPPRNVPLSANTRRLARSVLRRALRWAESEGMVARNVAALANGVKLNRTEGRTLTPEQARALLDHVKGDRLEAAFAVALALGLRRGELLGLSWDDLTIDASPPRMVITRNLTRVHGKGLHIADTKTAGSRRSVHLPAQVAEVLRSHRAKQAAERLAAGPSWEPLPLGADLVFRTEIGTAIDPNNFRQHVYRATREAFTPKEERPEKGEPWPITYQWSPHELRHSAASLLIAQGVPMKLVSETLGHSSIRVTADVYGHLFDEAGAVAADAMSEALWGVR